MFAIILILGFCIINFACSMRANEDDRITDDELWAHMRSFFHKRKLVFLL